MYIQVYTHIYKDKNTNTQVHMYMLTRGPLHTHETMYRPYVYTHAQLHIRRDKPMYFLTCEHICILIHTCAHEHISTDAQVFTSALTRVCIFTCVHMCTLIFTCKYVSVSITYTDKHICMLIYTHMCTRVHTISHERLCAPLYIHAHMYTLTSEHTQIFTHFHIHTPTETQELILVHTNIHMCMNTCVPHC